MPFRWHDTPPPAGHVVDAISGKPIADAVVVARARLSDRETRGETDKDGGFELASGTHWTLVPLGPFDPLYAPATLTITAPGYKPFQLSVSPHQLWSDTVRLEPVR